jgi:regulator of nucleoside diphosphate kinase
MRLEMLALASMNTRVLIHDLCVGRQTVYTLVFPRDADIAKNKISVLAPVGTALLGYRVGDLIECAAPGTVKRLRVKEIVYQPEAARHAA